MSPDCTERCKSSTHGDKITDAISKRSVSDADICAYLNFICNCCESVKDSHGRSALHVAASCGRTDLVRWLVQNRMANINIKDLESGYTALHRSIFYGKLETTVELIKLGSNVSSEDKDGLTCIEHAIYDGPTLNNINFGELYVWGSNSNNTLGPQKARSTPDLLDLFHKEYPDEFVKQICLAQFHTVIVTNSGKAFSFGHGQGGRLGLGHENSEITPKQITEFHSRHKGEPITCVQASIARDHSMFLMSDGGVYVCGLNKYQVLGMIPARDQLLSPKQLFDLPVGLDGVCAATYHCVAWGNKVLYTWGINGGQMGLSVNLDRVIPHPRLIKNIKLEEKTIIKYVAASDSATVICTSMGDIYVLHEYQCRKIAARQHSIAQISVIGGKFNPSSHPDFKDIQSNSELKVAVLSSTGYLYLWQESDPHLCQCTFSTNRVIMIKQVILNLNEVLFVTQYGEAFKGVVLPRKKDDIVSEGRRRSGRFVFSKKSTDHEFCIGVKVQKFPRIHRAIHIQSDTRGKDYSVIQGPPYKHFNSPDKLDSEMQTHFENLLSQTDLMDNIHDVVFEVDGESFPAHRYILASKSSCLKKFLWENKSKTIHLPGIFPEIFKQFINFIYTQSCELTKCGELKNEKLRSLCKKNRKITEETINESPAETNVSAFEYYNNNRENSKKVHDENSYKNPVRILHELAKRFAVTDLQNVLGNLDMQKYAIVKKNATKETKIKPLKFDRTAFPEFCDVTIICSDNKILEAHKCILTARSEYFDSMFSVRWKGSETSKISLPCSKVIAELLLEFLYTDTLPSLSSKDSDCLFRTLILADQLFITGLKDQCEVLLSETLTLKNAVQLISFATTYNTAKLKNCCMKFIISNIAPLLELQALNDLDGSILKELSEYYSKEKPEMQSRVITPYSTAVSDEEILRISNMYPVDPSEIVEKDKSTKSSQKRRPRIHRNSSEKNNSISIENDVSTDSIIQFPDIQEVTKYETENIPERLKAINSAREKIINEDVEYRFEKFPSRNSDIELNLSSSFSDSLQFPELNSPPPNSGFHYKTPQKIGESKHKMVKLSQKQRKRISSESNAPVTPIAESPKNPWKMIPVLPNPSSPVDSNHNMGSIISEEKRQKENLVKLTSKLLIYTQIEDKAIVELQKFYNSEDSVDELITIERVGIGAVASPVWVPKTNR